MTRRTLIVDSALAATEARTAAARDGEDGLQVMGIDQAAARLAGGFLQPIPREALQEAIQTVLPTCDLGPLAAIQDLPGMTRAATTTLQKAWDAGVALDNSHPRRGALGDLDQAACEHLRPSMRRPGDLVAQALARVHLAPAVLGAIEFCGVPDLAPVWRPLVRALAGQVAVTWTPDARPVPDWLSSIGLDSAARVDRAAPRHGVSCANPRHEAIEAMRWARRLIARGDAAPHEIALTAAAPAEWDSHLLAMSRDANIDIHFAHGRPVVSRPEGQACAALAEALLNGPSQDRIRRLVPLLKSQGGVLHEIPGSWTRVLPRDAPLTSPDLWRRQLARIEDWPEDIDFSDPLLALIDRISAGPDHAADAGDTLLTGVARAIWRQALAEGPPHALDVTLQGLRIADNVDPAAAIVWGPAATVAGAPRAHMRLLGLTSRAWPRPRGEDPLLPEHVVAQDDLDPVPVPERDRRDFQALLAGAGREIALSRSRRDAEGRQLGASPLWPEALVPAYLERSRVAGHVMSEADRLLARPLEFGHTPLAASTRACWIDWHTETVTPHDGLIRPDHTLVEETLARPQSTGALQKLLRDPLGYIWAEVLGWKEPAEDEEPITLDALAFGTIVHAVFEDATRRLETGPGLTAATDADLANAAHAAATAVAEWYADRNPVPPGLIWHRLMQRAETAVPDGIRAEFGTRGPGALPGQRSLAEVPFGQAGWKRPPEAGREPPWDVDAPVTIPGTRLLITGRIDRLDLAGDASTAAVVDYKTGKNPPIKTPPQVRGGREVQRCLYAFAVKSLMGGIPVDARLVYPLGERVLTLDDPETTLATLARYLEMARQQLLAGNAIPGEGTRDQYNDMSFALPGDAKERYFRQKRALFDAQHGELADVWSLT